MAFLKSFVFLLLLACSQTAFCQNDVVADIRQKFESYQAGTLQEKLYVHTDKPAYLAGEIMWFKLYYVDAGSYRPLALSKVAYVDVLDANGNAVIQVKVALKDGSGNGSVLVPLRVASGYYKLRAYTSWMKNFGSDQLFEKPITIINTLKNPEASAVDTTVTYAVALFPEGGNLVQGLESNVGVKVTGRNGKGIAFTGTIFDEAGDSVAVVTAHKFGMGRFSFTPASDHTYNLVVALPSGQQLKQALPVAYAQGYVMRMGNVNDGKIRIRVTGAGNNYQNSTVYLLVHNRNTIQVAEQKRLENGQAVFLLDTSKLAAGVTHVTVFNDERKPVCERLYFKKPVQKLHISATSDQLQYGTRKKVDIALRTIGAADTAAPMDLSVSVYKWDSLQDAGSPTILTYLWLTSGLSGPVEAADYYFGAHADAAEAADNLMLTQGWRRFRWEAISGGQKPAFMFPLEHNGQLVKARITDMRTGRLAAHIPVFLSIPGNPFRFYAAQSDSAGAAQFNVKQHYGPGELILQTNTAYDSVYRIELESPFAPAYATAPLPVFSFSKGHKDDLLHQSIGMQVQHIYRKDSLARFTLPEAYDTVPFYGQPNYTYLLDAYTRFPTLEEVLREYVQPINVVQGRGGLRMLILDEARRRFFESDELVLLDGIPLFDKTKIFAYDPLKVKKLDVVTKKYFVGPAFFNGIASFTTYNGNFEGFQLDPRSIIIDYEGLQLEREFYAPVYEAEQQYRSRLPDFRNTLLWKPHVETGRNGTAALSLYTSDQKGRYRVVIEGMDDKGNAVATHVPIEVN